MDSSKLIKVIKKIIKEEVKAQVKASINEVLANRFLDTISESPRKTNAYSLPSINESKSIVREDLKYKQMQQEERKKLDAMKAKLAEGAGLPEDFFSDIDEDDLNKMPGVNESVSVDDFEPDVSLDEIEALMGRK